MIKSETALKNGSENIDETKQQKTTVNSKLTLQQNVRAKNKHIPNPVLFMLSNHPFTNNLYKKKKRKYSLKLQKCAQTSGNININRFKFKIAQYVHIQPTI